jgi:hypothetical protein
MRIPKLPKIPPRSVTTRRVTNTLLLLIACGMVATAVQTPVQPRTAVTVPSTYPTVRKAATALPAVPPCRLAESGAWCGAPGPCPDLACATGKASGHGADTGKGVRP